MNSMMAKLYTSDKGDQLCCRGEKRAAFLLRVLLILEGFLSCLHCHHRRLQCESQRVIVVCLCASQRAGAAEEELCHRHRQEEAGGRVCCEYSHAETQFCIVCGG